MCGIALGIGILLMVGGLGLLVAFFAIGGKGHVETAGLGRTESMVAGALMASVGLLLTLLGATGTICARLGVQLTAVVLS